MTSNFLNHKTPLKATFLYIIAMYLFGCATQHHDLPGLSESTYNALDEVMTLTERQSYNEALEKLDELEKNENLNSFEILLIKESKARIFIGMKRYEEALNLYEVVAQDERSYHIHPDQETSYYMRLAMDYLPPEDAIGRAEKFFEYAPVKFDYNYQELCEAYFQVSNYKKVIETAYSAYKDFDNDPSIFDPDWFKMLFSAHKKIRVTENTYEQQSMFVEILKKWEEHMKAENVND